MKNEFSIAPARDEDWLWIEEQHVATAWDFLTPNRQATIDRETMEARVQKQMENIRKEHGSKNQVFVARDIGDHYSGFIWVGQITHGFTGRTQAYLLDLFVAEPFRGQGVGKALIATAEEWAKQKGFDRIGLNVAAHNPTAIGLYKRCGFTTESLWMNKSLSEPTH